MGKATSKLEENAIIDENALLNLLREENIEFNKIRDAFDGRRKINKQEFVDIFRKLYSNYFKHLIKNDDEIARLDESDKDDDMRKLAEHFFQAFDNDKDDYLLMSEFYFATHLIKSRDPSERLCCLFKMYDANNDDYLDENEIEDFLPVVLRLYPEKTRENFDLTKKVKEIVRRLDKNKDQKISIQEFHDGLLKTPAINDLFSIEFKSII